MANLKFIPQTTSKGSTPTLLPLDKIPAEVKAEVEEVYNTLKTNPGRMSVEFPSLGELNLYITQVKAYCDQRPAELGGPIRFRKSPTRNLPPTQMEFRITELQTEEEKTTEGIRNAADAANGKNK